MNTKRHVGKMEGDASRHTVGPTHPTIGAIRAMQRSVRILSGYFLPLAPGSNGFSLDSFMVINVSKKTGEGEGSIKKPSETKFQLYDDISKSCAGVCFS